MNAQASAVFDPTAVEMYGPQYVATVPEGATVNDLSYNTTYSFYRWYNGQRVGDRVFIKAPSKGSVETLGVNNNDPNTAYTSGTISLGYGEAATVVGRHLADGDTEWRHATGITVSAPSLSVQTLGVKNDDPSTVYTSGEISLDYGKQATVVGQYSSDGGTTWNNAANGLTITAQSDSQARTAGIDYAKTQFGIIGPTATDDMTAFDEQNAQVLSYDTFYYIQKSYEGNAYGAKTYFKAPSNNATTITKSDITMQSPSLYQGNGHPQGVENAYTKFTARLQVKAGLSYHLFMKVTVKGVSKWFQIQVYGTSGDDN